MNGLLARLLVREKQNKEQMGGCVRRRDSRERQQEKNESRQDEIISLGKAALVSSVCEIIPFY